MLLFVVLSQNSVYSGVCYFHESSVIVEKAINAYEKERLYIWRDWEGGKLRVKALHCCTDVYTLGAYVTCAYNNFLVGTSCLMFVYLGP
jgi:hypothetical protein